MIEANGRKSRDGILLAVLNWLERRYEIYTSKSLGRERSKSLALSVVSNFQCPSLWRVSSRETIFTCARVFRRDRQNKRLHPVLAVYCSVALSAISDDFCWIWCPLSGLHACYPPQTVQLSVQKKNWIPFSMVSTQSSKSSMYLDFNSFSGFNRWP